MSNYTKATDFAAKDSLVTGSPAKIIKGSEIDAEFVAIASAIATKADLASPALSGIPTAPTATPGTNTTQLATTGFVTNAVTAAVETRLPSGAVTMWVSNSAPTGWLICDGSAVSRTTYADLFAVIGTAFGAGDGSTTFNLPNFTDRFPVGSGNLYGLNSQGGSKDAIVVSHSHTYSGTTGSSGAHTHTIQTTLSGNFPAGTYAASTNQGVSGSASTDSAGAHTHSFSGTTAASGSSGTNANLPPYLGIRFIIKT